MNKFLLGILFNFFVFSGEFSLSITRRQKECLHKILYSLSEKNTASLLLNAFSLRSMGKEIDPIPPLDFLYYVYENKDLVGFIKNTRGRYFQWNAFISGFAEKCNKHDIYKEIQYRLDDFAKAIDLDVEQLDPFVLKKDWQGLVDYLINKERK